MAILHSILSVCCTFVLLLLLLFYAWRVVNIALIRPKRQEKLLRQQGIKGNSYRFIYGDLQELVKVIQEAKSKSINTRDDIKPRVIPLYMETILKYGTRFDFINVIWQTAGKSSLFWDGPVPTVIVTEPELIKEVMTKYHIYQKQQSPNPLTKLLARGVVNYETDKWAKHRKIINPAFHLDKLKIMIPAFISSCEEVMEKWARRVSPEQPCVASSTKFIK